MSMNAAAEPAARHIDLLLDTDLPRPTEPGHDAPGNTMTPPNLTHDLRTSPAESLRPGPGSGTARGTGKALRLRLAEPPPRTLEAHLAHALRMLGSPSGPLISMLRFRSHPGPSTRRQMHHGHQGRRP